MKHLSLTAKHASSSTRYKVLKLLDPKFTLYKTDNKCFIYYYYYYYYYY